MAERADHYRRRSRNFPKLHARLPRPKNYTFAADEADLGLIEGLRAVPAIFESGMATLSRDGFLRLLPALQNHSRATFGKGTHVKTRPSRTAAGKPES